MSTLALDLGNFGEGVRARLDRWQHENVAARLWAKDHTLWSPTPLPELTDRLGWLHLPALMHRQVGSLGEFAEDVARDGIRDVVVLGMGGSSLAPEVFQRTFGSREGFPRLTVLDSTHPAAVQTVARRLDLKSTLFVVSSKSGGTLETMSLFRYFWAATEAATGAPGRSFVAVTDPGSSLEALARERGFREIFGAPPDVGGRFSALSVFGLVPAALIGVDLEALFESAKTEATASADLERLGPGFELAAALAELCAAGRDKLTFVTDPALASLPDWIEQLVAESTGKEGHGIVPVVGETLDEAASYGEDRVFLFLEIEGSPLSGRETLRAAGHPVIRCILKNRSDLGCEFFRWEVATAMVGSALAIHPFDQPDVQLAKDLAKNVMAAQAGGTTDLAAPEVEEPSSTADRLARSLETLNRGDYVAVQAFLPPSQDLDAALARIRLVLSAGRSCATTVGYGPRFLHSTGQLHKGGPNNGVFLQLVDDASPEIAVPEMDTTFGQLITAQAAGDANALFQRQRRVERVVLGSRAASAVQEIAEALAVRL